MKDKRIFESAYFTASQASDSGVPGHLIVESRIECTEISGFTTDQSADLMRCLAKAETVVQEILEPERIYILKFGEAVPQVHFHVFPRTARLLQAYLEHVADQAPYSGARIMDWIWTHKESVGFTENEVQAFVDEARARTSATYRRKK